MNLTRLEHLQKFYQDDPNDPFNIYALAIEYQNIDTDKALEYFKGLLEWHSQYLPTYYTIGKLYEQIKEYDKAILAYEHGIELAKEQNETKALRELNSALSNLKFEMEE